jgi:hypothetical protein
VQKTADLGTNRSTPPRCTVGTLWIAKLVHLYRVDLVNLMQEREDYTAGLSFTVPELKVLGIL